MKKKQSKILGLDVSSTSTGYALLINGTFDKNNSGIIIGRADGTLGISLLKFGKKLDSVFKLLKPDVIVIEDTFFHNNVHTLKVLSRYGGIAIEHSAKYLKNKEPVLIPVQKIRKLLNTETKQDTFDFINHKFYLKWDFKEHNDITDALAVAIAYYNESGPIKVIKKNGANNNGRSS